MDKTELIRHAINIARLMQSVSDFVSQEFEQPPNLRRRETEEFVNYGKYEQPTQLSDIGLDDIKMAKIVIELSQDRSEFKIWTPFNQDFVDAIKEKLPKHARRWDANDRCWRVDCYWFGNVQDLLPRYYPDMERNYTHRAYEMCLQLAEDDEAEAEMHEKEKKKTRKKKATKKQSTKKKTRKKKEPAPRKEQSPYDVLNVREDAPDEVVKAAHRVLARLNHTDLGGDENKMKKINEAFERIKAERGWVKHDRHNEP
jgi:hypothetical protein